MPSKILCLKGFVFGVDWSAPNNSGIMKEVVEKAQSYNMIAFDGDLNKASSFTLVLSNIMAQYPDKTFVAFKKENKVHKLKSEYSEMDYGEQATGYSPTIPLDVRTVSSDMSFDDIGKYTVNEMQKEGSVDVIFLGGGKISEQEYDCLSNNNKVDSVVWYNVKRN